MSWKRKRAPEAGNGVRSVRPQPRPAYSYAEDMRRRALMWGGACLVGFVGVLSLGWMMIGRLPPADGDIPPPPPPPAFEDGAAPAPHGAPRLRRAERVAKSETVRHSPAEAADAAPFARPAVAIDGATSAVRPALAAAGGARCDWAPRRSEQMVCRDAELAGYDSQLAQVMRRAAQAGTPHWWLAAEQDRWALVDRERAAERSRDAVAEAYRERIAELEQLATRR